MTATEPAAFHAPCILCRQRAASRTVTFPHCLAYDTEQLNFTRFPSHTPALPQAAAAGGEPDGDAAKALCGEISLLRARRALRTLGLVQDLADLLMVLAEVRGQQAIDSMLS